MNSRNDSEYEIRVYRIIMQSLLVRETYYQSKYPRMYATHYYKSVLNRGEKAIYPSIKWRNVREM